MPARSTPVRPDNTRIELAELSALLFLHGMALGAWFVPLGPVLDISGLHAIKALAFACSAIAALVSPLIFGAMADRHVSPARLLRWLGLAATGMLMVIALVIHRGAGPWIVLAMIQLLSLCIAPTSSLAASIVMGRLKDPQRQFGPIRAMGTIGWMVGCWVVSLAGADTSLLALFISAGVWSSLALFTRWLPHVEPSTSLQRLTLSQRLGLDALSLLKLRDHQVVFVTSALFAIPLAAFYPFTPAHLHALGMERTAAWMSLGQITEVIAMLLLSRLLLNWRLKWILATGLALGFLRYFLYSLNHPTWVIVGLSLHGFVFAFSFILGQVYLNERIDPAWRTRSQALFSFMTSGIGSLCGYLSTGWWLQKTEVNGQVNWPHFWGGLSIVVLVVLAYFLAAYQGQKQPATGARSP